VAKNNAKLNESDITFINSDLFNNIDGKYDVIISNPPYISKDEIIMDSVDKYEPHLALYAEDNGLYFYNEILKHAKKYLKDKYLIAFEIGYSQAKNITMIAKQYFKESDIIVEKDLSGKDRYIFIKNSH
jgi:release factor glutamine methyltransferase